MQHVVAAKRLVIQAVQLVIWLTLAGMPVAARGQEAARIACSERMPLHYKGTVNLRIDNDMFGGLDQDQGYSNGFLMSWVSPNLVSYRDDPCLPRLVRGLNRYLKFLQPGGFDEQNMIIGLVSYRDDPCLPRLVRGLNRYLKFLQPGGFDEQNMIIGLGQVMYTPNDRRPSELIADDRPFAGALLLSLGYNARRGDGLRTTQIRFGMVGPTAHAKQTQNAWHDLIGVDRFHGWEHQLRNEAVLQLLHERRVRVTRQAGPDGWGWDLTRHWGASLGNFATYANAGGEWRFGLQLPDDLGTAPLRPAGENTSPLHAARNGAWSGHLFVALDARWVVHDITLDGNTYKASHQVDKRPLVADIGYGAAMYRGSWRVAFARYHRSREFRGQQDVPVYGTVTIGRRF